MKWLKPLLFQTHELAGPFRRYWKIANSVENMLCADVVRVQVALKWIKIKLNTFVQCRSRSFCTYNYLWMRPKERTVCGVSRRSTEYYGCIATVAGSCCDFAKYFLRRTVPDFYRKIQKIDC